MIEVDASFVTLAARSDSYRTSHNAVICHEASRA